MLVAELGKGCHCAPLTVDLMDPVDIESRRENIVNIRGEIYHVEPS